MFSHTKLKLSIAALFSAATLTMSCQKNELSELSKLEISKKLSVVNPERLSPKEQATLREEFAQILSLAVQKEPELNKFIKTEALKMFDLEYDILYHSVKDQIVSKNRTLSQTLTDYSPDKQRFAYIESRLPLLTLFVPELPELKPEQWKVESELPVITTALVRDHKVKFYGFDGKEYELDAKYIPGVPTVVVKNNERVTLVESNTTIDPSLLIRTNTYQYQFLSENFINKPTPKQKGNVSIQNTCTNCVIDPKVITAFNLWESYSGQALWQRDYIYYGISPTSLKGPYDGAFREHLTGIKFTTGQTSYEKISDQAGDPVASPILHDAPEAHWSEGSYEMSITALINSSAGLGADIQKSFPVKAKDLFNIRYKTMYNDFPGGILNPWIIESISPLQYNLSLPIAQWDIENTGTAWKILLEEIDNTGTTTETNTTSSTFATNFGYDIGWGSTVKSGLKFGASATFSNTQTYTLVTQIGTDKLGNAELYFSDPVITYWDVIPNLGSSYTFNTINTGWALLTIHPKRTTPTP